MVKIGITPKFITLSTPFNSVKLPTKQTVVITSLFEPPYLISFTFYHLTGSVKTARVEREPAEPLAAQISFHVSTTRGSCCPAVAQYYRVVLVLLGTKNQFGFLMVLAVSPPPHVLDLRFCWVLLSGGEEEEPGGGGEPSSQAAVQTEPNRWTQQELSEEHLQLPGPLTSDLHQF